MSLDESTYPQSQVTTPAGNAVAITPSDTVDLDDFNREIYVGIGGNLKVTMASNGETVTFVGLPGGSRLPYVVRRIWADETTATNIIAVW